jgi:hypothetical protein
VHHIVLKKIALVVFGIGLGVGAMELVALAQASAWDALGADDAELADHPTRTLTLYCSGVQTSAKGLTCAVAADSRADVLAANGEADGQALSYVKVESVRE